MQSAVPDVIGSSEAVPSGAASAFFPLAFLFLLHSAAPGVQSEAPGATGSAEARALWAPSCFFRVEIFADWASCAFFQVGFRDEDGFGFWRWRDRRLLDMFQ